MLKLILILILPFICYANNSLFILPSFPKDANFYAITNQNKAYIFNISNIILEYNFNTMSISDVLYLNYTFTFYDQLSDNNIYVLQHSIFYIGNNIYYRINILDNIINIFNLKGKLVPNVGNLAICDQNKLFVYTKYYTNYQLEIYDEISNSWTIHIIDDHLQDAFGYLGLGGYYGYNGIIYFFCEKNFDNYYIASYDYTNSNLTYLFSCNNNYFCININIILNNKMFSRYTDKYFDLNTFSMVDNTDTSWNFFTIYGITKNFFLMGYDDYPDIKYFFNINLNTVTQYNNEYYEFNLYTYKNKDIITIPIKYPVNYLNDFTIGFNLKDIPDYHYMYPSFNIILGDQSKLEERCSFNGWYHIDHCVCLPNYSGENCNLCNKGYYGNNCIMAEYCDPFGGNLSDGLSGNGSCLCKQYFFNHYCSQCITDVPRYGPDCSICPNCNSGSCNQGRYSHGECLCNLGIIGEYCDQCYDKNSIGKDCISCYSRCNGGKCVKTGYYANVSDIQCICAPKWRGEFCQITCPNCIFGHCGDDGYCKCDIGWSGEFCENKDLLGYFPLWAIISSIISFIAILSMIIIYKRYKTLVNENIPRNLDNFFNFRKESNKAYIRP